MIEYKKRTLANGLTVDEMARVVRAHPTFEEGVGEALEAFGTGAIHALPKKRRAV